MWAMTFPAEDRIFEQAGKKLTKWRRDGPNISEMVATESALAADAMSVLESAYVELKILELDEEKSAGPILELIKN
ncbi:unnamed protein product [marine sediment metagenome]|uniref:Uncharacterized protein n=1 Tax=marine sediment metagenome TaxID=412755 RepID=X1VPM2_9ZZZZ